MARPRRHRRTESNTAIDGRAPQQATDAGRPRAECSEQPGCVAQRSVASHPHATSRQHGWLPILPLGSAVSGSVFLLFGSATGPTSTPVSAGVESCPGRTLPRPRARSQGHSHEVAESLASLQRLFADAEPATQHRIVQALFEQVEVLGPNEVWLYPSVEAEARG